MIKLFISPNYLGVPVHVDNGGIRRVVEAENKYLSQFGVESVANVEEADVIQNHGGMQTFQKGKPIINTSHGLYWSRQPWGEGLMEVNKTLIDSMTMAVAHTAPSEWVARAIRRGGYFYPEVIYHGVDADEFKPAREHHNFVLWNKARADYVSDPTDMQKVALKLPNVKFCSTIGKATDNVEILGVKTHNEMKKILSQAGIYLATARETFGIGTLEAMACGVPIAGWNWGGQSEIIIPGETGYLCEPGNYFFLAECIEKCLADRERLSQNCIDDARMRWKWEPRIKQYADLVKGIYDDFYTQKRPKVSIIVTACRLDQYLPQCLISISNQDFDDFECIVVDDGLLDTTKNIVNDFSGRDMRIRYLRPPENLGLPGARNFGLTHSKGRYIRHLDADDWLAENALSLEVEALDNNPSIHIAYGHLCSTNADGSYDLVQGSPKRGEWPPKEFSWMEQMCHLNQLPSCTMMRREVMTKSGGYRVRNVRQEDAEFWCRVTSLGFRAKKVTEAITYFHRSRDDSKGTVEWKIAPEPDWTAWFPWNLGATDHQKGMEILQRYGGRHPNPNIVPFGAQGKCPDSALWPVHDYSYPVVSIILTCGPSHDSYLIDALDSIQAQTYPDWECIVINDTGVPWTKYISGAPWAKVINMEGNQGTSAARNEGLKYARGRCIVWMDADDYWMPWFLERMVAYAEKNEGIIFSDVIMDDGKEKKLYKYNEVDYSVVPGHMSYAGSSILVPLKIAQDIVELQGGFDTKIPGMEDWDYQIAVHSLGHCAYHIPEPLFVYRTFTSTKRETDYNKIELIREYLDEKWVSYRKEGKIMACGCSGKKIVTAKPGSMYASTGNFNKTSDTIILPEGASPTQMVNIEYMGSVAEPFSVRSSVDRSINYRFANNPYHKEKTVFLADALRFIQMLDNNSNPLYRIKDASNPLEQNPAIIVGAIN